MAKRNRGDFYATVKYHLFYIFTIILILFAMYKILVVEAPHQEAPKASPPCIPKGRTISSEEAPKAP